MNFKAIYGGLIALAIGVAGYNVLHHKPPKLDLPTKQEQKVEKKDGSTKKGFTTLKQIKEHQDKEKANKKTKEAKANSNYIVDQVVTRGAKYAPNSKYGIGIDWTVSANHHRLYIVDMKAKKIVYSWWTSHGRNSGGPDKATQFSNAPGSFKSSLGVMVTGETYHSEKHGLALKLIGKDKGINDNVYNRSIVLHAADYVDAKYIKANGNPGRSEGCLTLDPKRSKDIINMVKGGTPVVNITKR